MGLNLPLYCQPQDVYDLLSTEMGQSLLDDHRTACGQKIVCLYLVAQDATNITIPALRWPLLAGTVLEFDGAGLAETTEITVSQTVPRGTTVLPVNPVPVALPQFAEANDSGVNLALAQRLVKACQYGTTQVKLYCCSRYEDSDLQLNAGENGSVNRWSSILAARFLCSRRGQSPPKGITELVKEVLQELRWVKTGSLQIEDIGTRTAGWPFISNVTLDIGYDYRKLRVETTMSEMTPVQFPQAVDWNSALWIEY